MWKISRFWRTHGFKRQLTREDERLISSSLGSRFLEDEEGFALSCRERSTVWDRPSSLSSIPRRVDSLRVRLTLDSCGISVLNVTFGDGGFLGSGAGELERDLETGWCGACASSGCCGCCSNSISMFYWHVHIWVTAGICDIYIQPTHLDFLVQLFRTLLEARKVGERFLGKFWLGWGILSQSTSADVSNRWPRVTLEAYLAAVLRNLLVASLPKMSEYCSSSDFVLSNKSWPSDRRYRFSCKSSCPRGESGFCPGGASWDLLLFHRINERKESLNKLRLPNFGGGGVIRDAIQKY